VQVFRRGEFVEPCYDLGDFRDCRVLAAVVGDGLPEGDGVAAGNDGLVNADGAYGRIVRRLEPAGDGDRPPCGLGAMLLSLRVTTATKFTTVPVIIVLPGDCGMASALAAAMDSTHARGRTAGPVASRHARTRRAVVTDDSSGSYGKNSLSGIGSGRGRRRRCPLAERGALPVAAPV
jgi:hypothetical protein